MAKLTGEQKLKLVSYATHIARRIMEEYGPVEHDVLAWHVTDVLCRMGLDEDNPSYAKVARFMPESFDESMFKGESGNLNKYPWWSLTDDQRRTIGSRGANYAIAGKSGPRKPTSSPPARRSKGAKCRCVTGFEPCCKGKRRGTVKYRKTYYRIRFNPDRSGDYDEEDRGYVSDTGEEKSMLGFVGSKADVDKRYPDSEFVHKGTIDEVAAQIGEDSQGESINPSQFPIDEGERLSEVWLSVNPRLSDDPDVASEYSFHFDRLGNKEEDIEELFTKLGILSRR